MNKRYMHFKDKHEEDIDKKIQMIYLCLLFFLVNGKINLQCSVCCLYFIFEIVFKSFPILFPDSSLTYVVVIKSIPLHVLVCIVTVTSCTWVVNLNTLLQMCLSFHFISDLASVHIIKLKINLMQCIGCSQ